MRQLAMSDNFDTNGRGEPEEEIYFNIYYATNQESLSESYAAPYPDDALTINTSFVTSPGNPDSATPDNNSSSYTGNFNWSGPPTWPTYPQESTPIGELGSNIAYAHNANPLYPGDFYYSGETQPLEAQAKLLDPTPVYYQDSPSNHQGFYGNPASNTVIPAAPHSIGPRSMPVEVEKLDETIVVSPQIRGSWAQLTCKYCSQSHTTTKGLLRHEVEVHEKPAPGEARDGWYRCKCLFAASYFRKPNYTRHRNKCKPSKRTLPMYRCQCGREDADENVHATHYRHCSEGRQRVGRPKIDKNTANTNSGAGNGRRGRRSSKLDHVNELVAAKTLLTPLTPLTPFPQTPQTPQSQFSGATEDLRSPSQWSPLSLNSESVTWSTYGSLNFSE